MSRYVFEAWRDPKFNSILLAESKAIKRQKLVSKRAKLLYSIEADTGEEASAIHNLRQGWGPYIPNGKPAECPRCEGFYYPEGSSFCWKCGEIEHRPSRIRSLSRRRPPARMTDYRIIERNPTPEEFNRIRKAAGLSVKNRAAAERGIANSLYCASVMFKGECIGIGRVVGDGGLIFDIVDVAVSPDHQGKGIGKRIMEALMLYIRTKAAPTAFISLMTTAKLVKFYEDYGFKVRGPANPGMYQVIP